MILPIKVAADCYWVAIHIAGDLADAKRICRQFCAEVGECVTVTPTTYVYAGGAEEGVTVRFINYPRFPRTVEELNARALALALRLKDGLFQISLTIETPDGIDWHSWRAN